MSEDIITNRQLQRACSHPEPTTDSGGLTSGATRAWGGSPGVGVGVSNGDGFPHITLSAPGFRRHLTLFLLFVSKNRDEGPGWLPEPTVGTLPDPLLPS